MAKAPKSDVELVPDAWPRFERFIRDIAKAGPQHRKPASKTKSNRSMAAAGKYKPSEPMIVYDAERLPNGKIHIYPPYLLKPDGTASPL